VRDLEVKLERRREGKNNAGRMRRNSNNEEGKMRIQSTESAAHCVKLLMEKKYEGRKSGANMAAKVE